MFKVKKTIKFEKIFNAFAGKKSTSAESYKFTRDGDVVKPTDTPESIGLEEGDQIDAMVHQTGGARKLRLRAGRGETRFH
jgi:small ubiquitin-related modifier